MLKRRRKKMVSCQLSKNIIFHLVVNYYSLVTFKTRDEEGRGWQQKKLHEF